MEEFTFTLLLDYLYHRFSITFILTMLGVVIRILMSSVSSKQKVSIGEVLASTMFSTILMCAIAEAIQIAFTLYVLICVVAGMWNTKIVNLAMNSKFMTKLVTKYLKNIAGPVAKTLTDTLDDENNGVDKSKDDTKKEDREG